MQSLASWETDQWLGLTGLVFVVSMVAWLERRPATWHLAFAGLFLLFGAIHLLFPGMTVALWTTLALVATIGMASKLKYRYLGFNLLAGDLYYIAGNSFRSLLEDHARLVVPCIFGMVTLLLTIGLLAVILDEPAIALQQRIELFGAAACIYAIVFWGSGGAARFRFELFTQDRAHLSAFMASWLGAGAARQLAFIDIDADSLLLSAPVPATMAPGERPPHIIMVLHESTFDPRHLGIPINDTFGRFFSPQGGLSGALHVDVFGGGTVQTEFSILTGLSSLSFGSNSRFVFHRLSGRIRHSLPSLLTGIGYTASLVACDGPRSFNCGRFYNSIGIKQVSYSKMLPPPFDFERWERERHDEQLFDHALELFSDRVAEGKPCFLAVMTLMNHGDHVRRLFPPQLHAELRRDAVAETSNAPYGEYIVRLAESVEAYDAFRKGLEEKLDGQPAIIVRFGDHQPSFTAPLTGLSPSDPALRKTFYAIEAVNYALPPDIVAPPVLDVSYLSTLALQVARAPLDPIFATRASLLKADPAVYFDPTSVPKRRFHRTLVQAGLIDLA